MIDGSEKHNRQLAFELKNSHVCEKCSNGVSLYLPTIPTQTPQKRLENPTVKPAPNNINPKEVKYTLPSIIIFLFS